MIKLDKKSYDLLRSIDLSEMEGIITFNDDDMSFETEDLRLLQIILNEEIVTKGMKDQNEVTEHGRALYALYDAILDQK